MAVYHDSFLQNHNKFEYDSINVTNFRLGRQYYLEYFSSYHFYFFTGIDAIDFDEYEDQIFRRKKPKQEDDWGLFEEHEPRRKSIRRNTEEALKCPFCEKAFIGLVKHIKGKHRDEHNYEEEMRNAKWRERIMKVRRVDFFCIGKTNSMWFQ